MSAPEKPTTLLAALRGRCSRCKAPAGAWCRSIGGARADELHAERIAAAMGANSPETRVRGHGASFNAGKGKQRRKPQLAGDVAGEDLVAGGRGRGGAISRRSPLPELRQSRLPLPGLCRRCRKEPPWAHSPACFACLGAVELLITADGAHVDADAPPPRVKLFAARYRYRGVRCGKSDCRCSRSNPHLWYVYRAWSVDGRARERYLGPAAELRDPYERPRLRPPLPPFSRGAR